LPDFLKGLISRPALAGDKPSRYRLLSQPLNLFIGCLGAKSPVVIFALLLFACVTATASADDPAKQREFVYGLNLYNGVDFSTGFIPRYVDTLYVMADAQSTIDPKRTDVYWWPITNEYRGDFATVDEVVTGTLEISQGDRVVSSAPLTDYVIQFDRAGILANGHLYLSDEAKQRRTVFEGERAAYLKRVQDYTDASNAYTALIDELKKKADAGEQVTVPNPPNEPAPFTLFSTDVVKGFPLKLAAGEYQIRVRDPAGLVIPDSEKRVVAINSRREGIGYQVLPQEKWTTPDQADDPSNAIYTVPGGTVYLEPFSEREFNALAYARLQNPQDLQATANHWTWVHTAALQGVSLVIRQTGKEERLPLEEFSVQQVTGAALGYNVVPFVRKPDDPPPGSLGAPSPDLVAFKITAPVTRSTLSIALVDSEGHDIPGSDREIFVSPSVAEWQLALPVLLPLLAGVTVLLWRRDQIVTRRSLPPEKRMLLA
jgi:hypothetical protein